MASERTDELYKVLLDRGYPKEFCAEIAYKNMNTDYTATPVSYTHLTLPTILLV